MANEQPTTQHDPQSLVARIITELQASPEAQQGDPTLTADWRSRE